MIRTRSFKTFIDIFIVSVSSIICDRFIDAIKKINIFHTSKSVGTSFAPIAYCVRVSVCVFVCVSKHTMIYALQNGHDQI